MLKEFTQYIANRTSLPIGNTAAAHMLRAGAWLRSDPDVTTVVYETTGGKPVDGTRTSNVATFQIVSRARTVMQARDANNVVFAAINVKRTVTLPVVDAGSTWRVANIVMLSRPSYFGADYSGDFHFYGFNVKFPLVQDVSP